VGLKKFTSVQLYNVYTVAVNDNPCVVFQGKVSSGCRERCAHMGLPSSCLDSGLPFDIHQPFNTTMLEGQLEPILLGGLVSKVVDEYDAVTRECFYNLSDTLSLRGEDSVDPPWLSECPRFSLLLSARNGEIALNSREFVEFFAGESQRYASQVAFLGFPVDTNAATRMLRFRMSEAKRNFNSNLGTEIVSLRVSDQGFSGSDTTGEFDGTTADSIISLEVVIKPVNNPPEISIPRAEDPIEPLQNQGSQLASLALDPGLKVVDRDSDECGGHIVMKLNVMYGGLSVPTLASPDIEALSPTQSDSLEFYADAQCKEEDCASIRNIEGCGNIHKCAFDIRLNLCTCKKTRPGKICNSLRIRGPQADVGEALRVLVYNPLLNTNYFSLAPTSPGGDILQIEVSDKKSPDDALDINFNCGEVLEEQQSWQTGQALIQTIAQSQPCTSSFDPEVDNPSFETPVLCQGLADCIHMHLQTDDSTLGCVGVAPEFSEAESGWTADGKAGISHLGWLGDVTSFAGSQHVYLAPEAGGVPASVEQQISNFLVGGTYRVSVRVGARMTPNFGAAFQLTISDDPPSEWNGWTSVMPSIQVEEVRPTPGVPFTLHSTAAFFAYSPSYLLKMSSWVQPTMDPQSERIVFVDDVQVSCLQYNLLEQQSMVLSTLRILDPDYTEGVVDRLARQGEEFIVRVQITALHGVFSLVPPPPLSGSDCFIMPPSRLLSDAQRISWGLRCADLYGDIEASTWANMTLFRPDCPPGWSGLGTSASPCVKLSLRSISLQLTEYNDALLPFGQSQIPTRHVEMEGTLDDIEHVLGTSFEYVPNVNFNTVNLGLERMVVRTNDLGMYNGVPVEEQNSLSFFIEAVNDSPQITFVSDTITMQEDTTVALLGVQLSDDDLDEVPCQFEPCLSGSGTLQLKVQVSNGTVFISDTPTVNFYDILLSVFGAVSPNRRVHECLMRVSCNPNGGLLTLGSTTKEHLCGTARSPRCKDILQYCALAELALPDVQVGSCQQTFAEADIDVANTPSLIDLDVKAMSAFTEATDAGGVVEFVRDNFIVLVGSLAQLQAILDKGLLKYKPAQYQNGDQLISFTVHDQGNVGIGYPCDAPADIPVELMFSYCREKAPVVFERETKTVTVTIEPINNLPQLEVYGEDGFTRVENNALTAVQNVTSRLNRMAVLDPDIQETPGCEMKVDVTTRSGGIVFFNTSLSPLLKYTPSPTLTSLSVEGSLDQINTLMANLNYRSDPQFSGLEDMVVDISDKGCTGSENANHQVVTVIISILVNPPDTCQFDTCRACTQQSVENCGWCPSSCKGLGKCRNAQFRGGPPTVGECAPLCVLGACMGWNMCSAAANRSWELGATFGPLLLVFLLGFYLVNMWARRVHGTIPIYIARLWRIAGGQASKLFFAPTAGSKTVQISFLALSVVVFIVAFMLDSQKGERGDTYSLGEAQSFLLNTDACVVTFTLVNGRTFRDAIEVRTHISANGSLAGVFVQTDFCETSQFVFVNNTRDALNRYKGYSCDIDILIPEDPNHVAPVMEIANMGSSATVVKKTSESAVVNFGANMFSVSGTKIELELTNVKARRFSVPHLESGFVMMQNSTFLSVGIKTVAADVLVSVSQEIDMLVPYSVVYRQASNNVCFVSRNDTASDNLYAHTDRCRSLCASDATAGHTPSPCPRECLEASTVRLLPYKRNLQPGLKDLVVDLESESGQLYFSAIAHDRVPPQSGKHLLDSLYVFDGLAASRSVGLSPSALSVLQDAFRPAQQSRPVEELLRLQLQGPARPLGYFVWVADPRYISLSKWSLYILSLGALLPSERAFKLPFRPSECPPFDLGVVPRTKYALPPVTSLYVNHTTSRRQSPHDSFDGTGLDTNLQSARRAVSEDANAGGNTVYLRSYYRLLYSLLRGDEFPAGSMIAYKPVGNFPFVTFQRDTQTNTLSVNEVDLLDYPLTLVLLIIGLVGPVLAAVGLALAAIHTAHTAMMAFTVKQMQQDIAASALLDFGEKDGANGTESGSKKAEDQRLKDIHSGRSFFYFVDLQIGNPDVQQSIQVQVLHTVAHIGCAVLAAGPLLVFLSALSTAHRSYMCTESSDENACLSSQPVSQLILGVILWIYFVISLCELYAYYAYLPPTWWRGQLRMLFFSTSSLLCLFTAAYSCILVTWICLGILIRPAQFLPYAIGFFGSVAVCFRRYRNLSRISLRFRVALKTRCENFINRAVRHTPYVVVKLLVAREEATFLQRRGLSASSVLNSTALLVAGLSVVIIILLVSFHGLTNTNDIFNGVFNALATLGIVNLVDLAVNRVEDHGAHKQNLDALVEEVIANSKFKLAYLQRQVEIGQSLVRENRKHEIAAQEEMEAGFPGDDTPQMPQWKGGEDSAARLRASSANVDLLSRRAKEVMAGLQSQSRYIRTDDSIQSKEGPDTFDNPMPKAKQGFPSLYTVVLQAEADTLLLGTANFARTLLQVFQASNDRIHVEF